MAALLLSVMTVAILFAGCGAAEIQTAEAVSKTVEAESGTVKETRVYKDSLGREVELPVHISKVAVSGPMSQTVLFALCPDKLVGLSNRWEDGAEEYIAEQYISLPLLGQLYGGKGELNLESLLASGAEVIIDVGEPKGSAKEDLDALQEQTGIPFLHITATLSTFADAIRMLGDLLEMQEHAEELARYCETVLDRTAAILSGVEKKRLLYLTGEEGLSVIARDSYHGEVIDWLSDNLAVVDNPSSKGTGNEVDLEQILNWNPDVLVVAPGSIYPSIGSEDVWQQVAAVQAGAFYEVPEGPDNWMGFPPSVQRMLGVLWMTKLLYPEPADYDLCAEVTEYYKLFYHCTLTEEQFGKLVENSIGKTGF